MISRNATEKYARRTIVNWIRLRVINSRICDLYSVLLKVSHRIGLHSRGRKQRNWTKNIEEMPNSRSPLNAMIGKSPRIDGIRIHFGSIVLKRVRINRIKKRKSGNQKVPR